MSAPVTVLQSVWVEMVDEVRGRLRRLCRTDHDPSHEDLVTVVRDVWPRFGWHLHRHSVGGAWADMLDGARMLLGEGVPCPEAIHRDSYHHRLVACCTALGWVDAPWSLDPAPNTWGPPVERFPGTEYSAATTFPVIPRPAGWDS
jgi:hypothetical protein